MGDSSQLDVLLDKLVSVTQSLVEAPKKHTPVSLRTLLEERGRLAGAIEKEVGSGRLAPQQQKKLKAALEAAETLLLPLIAKRETLHQQLKTLRGGRRVQESLKPYRCTKGRRLNVRM